jgi:hypothetical protein
MWGKYEIGKEMENEKSIQNGGKVRRNKKGKRKCYWVYRKTKTGKGIVMLN